MSIRKAVANDLSRIAEIYVFNNVVFDDGVVKGFIQMEGTEICKLYVDTFFQSGKIGARLLEYAVREFHADHLWALEKNTRAISFYQNHGFVLTGDRQFEEGTTEYLLKLVLNDESKLCRI